MGFCYDVNMPFIFPLRFTVGREVNFAYWIQLYTDWGQSYERKEHGIFFAGAFPFTKAEQQALHEVNARLFAPESGFLWLWKRYAGVEFEDEREKKWWEEVKKIFQKRFDLIWTQESLLLENWQNILSAYPVDSLNDTLARVARFFEIKSGQRDEVEVKLCIRGHRSLPNGHVKREFSHLAVLNVSRVEPQYEKRVIATLVHELSHLLEHRSPRASALLKNSFEHILVPHQWKIERPRWQHLFLEAVISSIASRRYEESYVGEAIFEASIPNSIQERKPIVEDVQNGHYTVFIGEVGQLLLPLTTAYLESSKPIDQAYADSVARAWVSVGEKYNFPVRVE